MNIYYITNYRMPTEKAHGYQTARMCSLFAQLGHKVKLVSPVRANHIKESVFDFYDFDKNFSIKFLRSPDLLRFNSLFFGRAYYLQIFFFLLRLLFFSVDKSNLVYTRTPEIAYLFSKRGYRVLFEAHYWPTSKTGLYKKMLSSTAGIICNSQGTLDRHKDAGLKNLFLAPNGVDIDKFDEVQADKKDLRQKLSLDKDKKILMYMGHLYPWKGSDVLVGLADRLRDKSDFLILVAGGTDKDIKKYKQLSEQKKLNNIVFLGGVAKVLVPSYLKSADVLLLPNVPISDESINYTSPIKMFEYMATNVPILSSDLPSIREVLSDSNSFLFTPGDINAMENNLEQIFDDYGSALAKAEAARRDVSEFTWSNRAKKIAERFFHNV